MKDSIPIAVFAYNRPEHLRLALESLGRCEGFDEHPLHIFCDAPKAPQAASGAAAVRDVARAWIDARGGSLIERQENLEFRNITEGISQMCREYGTAIVVEDDIIVSPDFLSYLRAGLERYRDEPGVYLISAFMYADTHPPESGVFFLSCALVWGWATWERAWKHYSMTPSGWRELLNDPVRSRRFDMEGGVSYTRMLERTLTGKLNTWDIQWNFIVFDRGGLGLYPHRSLVWNTGFGSGVHMTSRGTSAQPCVSPSKPIVHGDLTPEDFRTARLEVPLVFPETIQTDEDAYARLRARLQASRRQDRRPWPTRLLRRFTRRQV